MKPDTCCWSTRVSAMLFVLLVSLTVPASYTWAQDSGEKSEQAEQKTKQTAAMSEKDIWYILDDIRADLRIGEYIVEAKWGDSPMVKLCKEYSLYIFPSGKEDHIAECMCPTGRSHRIYINFETSYWFCGYCRINGHVEELRGYLNKERSL